MHFDSVKKKFKLGLQEQKFKLGMGERRFRFFGAESLTVVGQVTAQRPNFYYYSTSFGRDNIAPTLSTTSRNF